MDIFENEPDDADDGDEHQSPSTTASLSEALAAVEKRLGGENRAEDMDIGPLDLDALAAVEDEPQSRSKRKTTTRTTRCRAGLGIR